jgi:hypothetical protein
MQLTINTTFPELIKVLNDIPREVQQKVLRPALKQAADTGKTQLIRQILANYNIARSEVVSAVSVHVQDTPALINGGISYKAVIKTSSNRRALNAIRFIEKSVTLGTYRKRKKTGTSTQLHARIRKNEGYKPLGRNVFIGNKGRTVFYVPHDQENVRGRKKIKAFSTINIPMMAEGDVIQEKVIERIEEVLLNRINNQLERYLRKIG